MVTWKKFASPVVCLGLGHDFFLQKALTWSESFDAPQKAFFACGIFHTRACDFAWIVASARLQVCQRCRCAGSLDNFLRCRGVSGCYQSLLHRAHFQLKGNCLEALATTAPDLGSQKLKALTYC